MDGPLVSVVVPLYNGERHLATALNSIFDQDYRPLEVIVVDDGSTDNGAEIARASHRVRYVYQSHQGVAHAWNTGIAAAKGKLIAFLAQDDLWTPNKLSVQVGYMVDNPHIQYTVSKERCFLEPGCSIPRGFRTKLLESEHVARLPEALVARKSLFDVIGGFNTVLTTSHDIDWFARAKDENVPMAVIDEVLLHRRIHDANATYSASTLQQGEENLIRVLRQSVKRQRGHKPSF